MREIGAFEAETHLSELLAALAQAQRLRESLLASGLRFTVQEILEYRDEGRR